MPVPLECRALADEIDRLKQERSDLQTELQSAPTGERAGLARKIKRIGALISAKQPALDDCIVQYGAETIGALKKILAEQGDPWWVDPRLSDEEAMPSLPRGAQADEDIPREDRIPPLGRDVDIMEIIGRQPPSNPWLLLEWVEAGLLDRSAAEGVTPMGGEEEFGAS